MRPRLGVKKAAEAGSPTAEDVRAYWGAFPRGGRRRHALCRCGFGKANDKNFAIVDGPLDPATLEAALEEAADYDVEGETRRRSRLEEIEIMAKFSAYEPGDRRDFVGRKSLKMRFEGREEGRGRGLRPRSTMWGLPTSSSRRLQR